MATVRTTFIPSFKDLVDLTALDIETVRRGCNTSKTFYEDRSNIIKDMLHVFSPWRLQS